MDTELHWWVWLLSGMAVGLIPAFGDNKLLGVLQTLAVISSPVVIFMKAGAAILPFALFYGGLMLVASFIYRRKQAGENRKLQESIAKKKKSWGA